MIYRGINLPTEPSKTWGSGGVCTKKQTWYLLALKSLVTNETGSTVVVCLFCVVLFYIYNNFFFSFVLLFFKI